MSIWALMVLMHLGLISGPLVPHNLISAQGSIWALVLMHLGLISRPLVPHNLISVQGSPVPLLKFQMAPRLNF